MTSLLICGGTRKQWLLEETRDKLFLSSRWEVWTPSELDIERKYYRSMPGFKGDVICMLWEGGGFGVIYWNGTSFQMRLLDLKQEVLRLHL